MDTKFKGKEQDLQGTILVTLFDLKLAITLDVERLWYVEITLAASLGTSLLL